MDKANVVKKEDLDLPERRETLDLLEILERKDPRYNNPSIINILLYYFITLLQGPFGRKGVQGARGPAGANVSI